MLKDLFKDPKEWILVIDSLVTFNEPVLTDTGYHYLYCWVNLDTQWCYIGKHKSWNAFNQEQYLGSCGNDHYWNSRNKHEFKCIILQYCKSEDELFDLEESILSEQFIQKFSEKGIFNLTTGGKGSTYHLQDEDVRSYAESRRREFFLEMNKEFYGEDANCCSHMQDPEIQAIAHERSKESLLKRNRELYGKDARWMTHLHQPESELEAVKTRLFNSINSKLKWYRDNGATEITPFVFWSWSDDWNLYHHIANVLYHIDELRDDSRWTIEMESIYPYYTKFLDGDRIDGNLVRSEFENLN